MNHPSLLLVGCGRMGSALLARWQQKDLLQSIAVIDPNANGVHPALVVGSGSSGLSGSLNECGIHANLDAYTDTPDLIIFAIKPQMLESELPKYAAHFGSTPLYVSIAAGKSLQFYETHLGTRARIIRTMPNTPSMVGAGMTALVANAAATPEDVKRATALFDAVGKTIILKKEETMDTITAISGSGPAYVFAFMEALVKAAIESGLKEDDAKALVLQTVKGAAELAATSPESFSKLRENVTSPGGTTEAALSILYTPLQEMVSKAVAVAIKRSKEL